MWHLSTEVKGELKDPNTTSLELAIALHPTPAVCGDTDGRSERGDSKKLSHLTVNSLQEC